MSITPLVGSRITITSEHIRMYVIRRLGQGERVLFTVVWVQKLLRWSTTFRSGPTRTVRDVELLVH
jgi:hypothetical protein